MNSILSENNYFNDNNEMTGRGIQSLPSESCFYGIETRKLDFTCKRGFHFQLIELFFQYPLLSVNTLCRIYGSEIKKSVQDLYEHGILSRFYMASTDQNTPHYLYFISENAFAWVAKGREDGFHCNEIRDLSVSLKLEIASISQWCVAAFAFDTTKSLCFRSYKLPAADGLPIEAVLDKTIRTGFFHNKVRCRFHLISCPKNKEQTPLYLKAIGELLSATETELQRKSENLQESFIVTLCENVEQMEQLADFVIKSNITNSVDAEKYRIFYTLITDSFDTLGAFKFLHEFTKGSDSINHRQIAIK